MSRWSTLSSSNRRVIGWAIVLVLAGAAPSWGAAAERDPVTLRVVVVNPSAEKTKTVPVRIDLPQEIAPADILEHGELNVEFDEERSLYYVAKSEVSLAPKQTLVFEVVVRDVWFVPDADINALTAHTDLVLKRLEKSEYYDTAKQLGESIKARLQDIQTVQSDEALSRKARIGAYRRHQLTLREIKDDLTRMEKLLSFVGGVPVPELMEESSVKSDAPSTTTTWLVIFLIVIFMGLLAGQFFFTWQRRMKAATDFADTPHAAFGKELPQQSDAAPPSQQRV